MTRRRTFEQETGEKLPRNMEARPMLRGGYSFRVMLPNRSWVKLGWNYDEAIERYQKLFVGPDEESVQRLAKEIHDRHRKGAKDREIDFQIDQRAIENMLRAQKMCCAVTGRRFSLENLPGVRTRPYAPSLDRIKSDRGYTEDNCRLVCSSVNRAISDLGDETFMALFAPLIRRIVREELAIAAGMMPRKAA